MSIDNVEIPRTDRQNYRQKQSSNSKQNVSGDIEKPSFDGPVSIPKKRDSFTGYTANKKHGLAVRIKKAIEDFEKKNQEKRMKG